MKYAWIRAHRHEFPITVMCRVLKVSASGFYHWRNRKPSARQVRHESLSEAIEDSHVDSNKVYGYRKVYEDLLETFGNSCCEATVRTIMKKKGLRGKRTRKFIITTDSNHAMPVAENILNREFDAQRPNEKWVADITYIPTYEGWSYLATVMDLCGRRVVGWATSKRIDTALISEALHQAIRKRQPGPGLLHHSDRGSQYASKEYQNTLNLFKMKCSMSRKGNYWDNACMERFFSSLKSEWICDTVYKNHQEATTAIFEYIETFYNPKRRHAALGYKTPIQYENQLKQHNTLAA